ncbi:Rz1-like lysis system protein LysC [Escherichia coli]|nr:Rz1-like lysis system protein LysC [Escherichia coli]MDZ9739065.1 Rz1-like lysis system protein LysC [Escherichia coli]MEA0397691.1 Rz1-like lysis system protein LysC [Escherichia coli]MEA0532506.1 Rz1-like lysis system protein LysC [Escherichia coli]
MKKLPLSLMLNVSLALMLALSLIYPQSVAVSFVAAWAILATVIRQLENALARCASQVKMIKHCQDENDAQTRQPAQGAD